MRKTIYLTFLLVSVLVCTVARSQEITLNRDGASLQDLFLEIHHQTGYFFYYSNKDLSGAKPVSIHVTKAPLEEVLDLCFEGQPLIYKLNDHTIVVQKRHIEKNAPTDIKGKVLNEQGEPVEVASVQVRGTSSATWTNGEGIFSLEKVPEESMLIITHIGYEAQTITVHKNSYFTIILNRLISKLDEVQVIAYGTTSQRLTTGNASKISSEEIGQQPVSDPLAAMSGRMPGVYIQEGSGIPGGAFSVQIRGRNSLRPEGNNPLYIVDGVQFSSTALDNPYTTMGGGGSSPLNDLNPSDIESIEILKDADATAIYGSRGANGVILITTKKGKGGDTRVDLGYSTGIEQITRKMDLLNTPEYIAMRREAFLQDGAIPDISNAPDLLLWDTARNTDWQKDLIGQTAHRTLIDASVSGGSRHTQFLLGASYLFESTVIPGNFSDKKGSFHLSLNNSSENEKFTSQLLLSYVNDNRYLPQSSLIIPVMLSPDAPPVYDSTGGLNWASSTWVNPGSYFLQTNQGKSYNLIANLTTDYKIFPGLELKSSMGYNIMDLNQVALNPLASYSPAYGLSSGNGYFSDNKTSSWVAEPELSFAQKIAKGNLHFQLGGTLQQTTLTALDQLGVGFTSDKQLDNLQNAATVIVLNSGVTDYHYIGLFSRLSFNWQDKYLLNLTARRDGSSRFGPGKQFGNFGALGLGWIFTKAAWFRNHAPWFSFGKIRASYGTAGNDQIANYGYLDTYQSTGFVYQGVPAMQPQSLANPDFSWETIRKTELGLQTGFFKDHLLLNISYYQNRSSDQLVGYSLPVITGFSSVIANLPAIVQNNGWEIEFNTVNLRNNQFSWTSSANITIPRNKLLAYPNLAGSSYANSYVVGQSMYISKVYLFQGVDPQTGVYTFRDYDKDGEISYPNDAQYVEKVGYDFYGGIGNSISYKAFQLNFFVQFVRQVNINYTSNFLMPGSFIYSAADNQPTEVLDHWQSPDKTGKIERYTQDFSSAAGIGYSNYQFSNRDYADASFVRIKNISVSYIFPARLLKSYHLKEAKINLQFQNLFTFTRYPGFDPETGTGIPPLKAIVAGIQVSL